MELSMETRHRIMYAVIIVLALLLIICAVGWYNARKEVASYADRAAKLQDMAAGAASYFNKQAAGIPPVTVEAPATKVRRAVQEAAHSYLDDKDAAHMGVVTEAMSPY